MSNTGEGSKHTITAGWSAEEEQTLREKWGAIPASEIAPLVHKSSMAVIGKANRLGLPAVSRMQAAQWAHLRNRERLAREVV